MSERREPVVPTEAPANGGATAEPANLETPAAASSEPVAETPAVVETPAATPAEAAPEGVVAPELKPHTDEPGTLVAEIEAKEAKTEPKEAEPTPKEAEPKPEAEPAEYKFTLPEGIELQAEPLEKFTSLARERGIAPEAAQQLVDMHIEGMQALQAQMQQQQHDAFLAMRKDWKAQMMADPDYGGSGFQTSVATALRMLNLFVEPARREAFNAALMTTGLTDHPEMLRFLMSMARKFDEPQAIASGGPPPDAGRGGRASGRSRIQYEHPRGNGRA